MNEDAEASATLSHQVVDRCRLLTAHGGTDAPCAGSACVYWRVLGHVGVEKPEDSGCAVRYFDLLADEQPEIASWLATVKARFEAAGIVPANGLPLGSLLDAAAADGARQAVDDEHQASDQA